MKALIALTIALSFNFAHAGDTIMTLEDCAAVMPIAVLAKDNMPYWTESQDTAQKVSCYNTLKAMASGLTPSQIRDFNEEFEGQVVICGNDEEFANFISANKENETVAEEFTVESSVDSWTPVYKPKTVFFQNSSLK